LNPDWKEGRRKKKGKKRGNANRGLLSPQMLNVKGGRKGRKKGMRRALRASACSQLTQRTKEKKKRKKRSSIFALFPGAAVAE